MILEILEHGNPAGMTADEIGQQLVQDGKLSENNPNFTRPRLTELKAEGKVKIVGRRSGSSGCEVSVWQVVKK